MEIQRIEEIHDDTAFNNKMDSDATQPNLRTDGTVMQPDFEDEFPADLISISDTEEGPEVFKRVRFLSRWEFRRESRGALRYTIGPYNWWVARGPEIKAMKDSLDTIMRANTSRIFAAAGENIWQRILYLNIFFVGSTLQQSRPVLFIFCMTKQVRREAWKHCTEIDWIRANPTLVLLTSCSTVFHLHIKKGFEARYGKRLGGFLKASEVCAN
jgi:hypothetical protein